VKSPKQANQRSAGVIKTVAAKSVAVVPFEPTQPCVSGAFFWEAKRKKGGLRSETAQLFSRFSNQTSMTAMILWLRSTMMI
jgi:hypothetical protein